MDQKKLLLIASMCGVVIFIGVLMPWASFSGPSGMMSASANGTSEGFDAGVLILLLGLVGGAAALLSVMGKSAVVPIKPKQQLLIGTACFAVALLFTLINFFKDFFQTIDTPMGSAGTSRGIGLWLTLLAAIAGTACFVLVLKNMGAIPSSSGGDDE